MTKPAAPPVTPCPVTWCPCAGHHEWSRLNLSSDPERWHTVKMLEFVDDDGAAHPQVTAEHYETTAGYSQTTVELFSGYAQLLNRGEVTELVDAIKRAADVAFGPVSTVVDANDFDAALKEVVDRAANPTDVNRLVAAAIRFRQAYLAVDAELDAEEKAEATR